MAWRSGSCLNDPQLRPFGQGIEIAGQAAADHVAFEADVVAGREHGGVAFAFRHFAAAEDADLDQRTFGQLAQQLAVEVVGAVVERDDAGCRSGARCRAAFRFLPRVFPAVITGHSRPVAIMAITSTR